MPWRPSCWQPNRCVSCLECSGLLDYCYGMLLMVLWGILLFVFLVFLGIAANTYRMMRNSDRMLDDIDKSKLNELDDDDWR